MDRKLTAERLREILDYNPETKEWRWRVPKQGRSGRVGSVRGDGRLRIMIDRRAYYANVLAWLWVTGEWPSQTVDHSNTDPSDDRWDNLRLATRSQQQWNRGKSRANTSGFVGVTYEKSRKKWRAHIRGRIIGRFATKEEAYEAYRKAALEEYGEFAHHSLRSESRR